MSTLSIPIASKLPLIGSAMPLLKDPLKYFVKKYHEKGSIYRVKAFNMSFIVMGGVEANQFMQKNESQYFSAEESWFLFNEAFDADKSVIASDGEEHLQIRKFLKNGYSPNIMRERVPEVIDYIKDKIKACGLNKEISPVPFMQKLVTAQMGYLMADAYPEDYFYDILYQTRCIINVSTGRWPKIITKFPRYIKAKRRSIEFSREVISSHRKNPNKNGYPDFVDDLLAANENIEDFFSENDLVAAALGPFTSGLDTVSNTVSFMLYEMLKHPTLMEGIRQEVDEVFDVGISELSDFRKMKKLQVAIMETMRLHPAAISQMRKAKESFEFKGYKVKKGETILSAMTITHFLSEFFPNPYKFDMERYTLPRNEHKQSFAFNVFGLGQHFCPGSRFAEVYIVIIMSSILRYAEFEPLPKNFKMTIDTVPTPSPTKKFKLKIKKFRNMHS